MCLFITLFSTTLSVASIANFIPEPPKCTKTEYGKVKGNDFDGYITKSKDGLNFETPKKLFFDNGSIVGNYNTQTHFLENVGKVYLVYTRKGANNDHVFRHRAPLFVAQVNEDSLTLKKSTERAIIPERGARLGNFGCSKLSEGKWVVVAAEWMQGAKKWQGCMKYGSDNSIFATEIEFNK